MPNVGCWFYCRGFFLHSSCCRIWPDRGLRGNKVLVLTFHQTVGATIDAGASVRRWFRECSSRRYVTMFTFVRTWACSCCELLCLCSFSSKASSCQAASMPATCRRNGQSILMKIHFTARGDPPLLHQRVRLVGLEGWSHCKGTRKFA